MPRIDRVIRREVEVVRTARLQQMLGMFDVPPASKSVAEWNVSIELPERWSVGAIVGPSGSGKSTLAREIFGAEKLVGGWDWPEDKSVVDGFPEAMSIRDVTALLSAVGFSSPPAWVRPFGVLSNGQQFRCTLARTLAEMPDLAVVDEFTSVVDRTVAQIGSAAVAKAVRRRGQRFVAVTCHYDVLDWLEPDWVYEPQTGELKLNAGRGDPTAGTAESSARGSLWRRPAIELEVVRTTAAAWELFKAHHYLSGELHRSAKCFAGLVNGRPAAFTAVLPFPHATAPGWREHRTVCLPDFQGVGIGNALSEYVASLFASRKAYLSCTSHPGMIRHRARSPLWRMTRKASMVARRGKGSKLTRMGRSIGRSTTGFKYTGPARAADAAAFAI